MSVESPEVVTSPEASIAAGNADGGTLLDKFQSVPTPTDDDPRGVIAGDVSPPTGVEAAVDSEVAEALGKTGEAEPAQEEKTEAEAAEPDVGSDDPLDAYLAELMAEGEEGKADAEALASSERASNRVREAVNEKNAAVEQMQQMQQQWMQMQMQYQQQMAQQQQQFQQQLLALQRPPEQVDPHDPFNELVGQLNPVLEEQVKKLTGPLQEKLNAYEARERQLQQQLQQRQVEQQVQQHLTQLEAEAKSMRSYMVPGLPDDVLHSPEIGTALDEILITKAVAENKPLQEVLPAARKMAATLVQAYLKAGRTKGTQLKEKAAAPKSSPQGNAPAKQGDGLPNYSLDQIRSAGYSNRPDAMRDQFRKLKGQAPENGYF